MSKPYSELRNKMTAGQRERVKAKVETLKKEPKMEPRKPLFKASSDTAIPQ